MKNIELTHPNQMSAPARAVEITSTLAAAIIRSQAVEKNSQSAQESQIRLGFPPGKSVHTTPYQQE
jgi:hypothetical protein